MWTRKEIKDFKDSVKSDPESVIQVGSGEIVTVSTCLVRLMFFVLKFNSFFLKIFLYCEGADE